LFIIGRIDGGWAWSWKSNIAELGVSGTKR
jgi:hypothetical protein